MTEDRLEKLYWELDEMEDNAYLLQWSADDLKMLNHTKLKIWDTIYLEYHDKEDPVQLMRDMLNRRKNQIEK